MPLLGCDSTSAFVRQGKSKPLKILLQNEDIQGVFQDVGEQIYLSEKTIENLEKFTCKMYGSVI